MKRQRARNAEYRELLEQNDGIHDENDDQRNIQMQIQQRQRRQRQENTLEAQIQPGDTLQAIALRYNCTISDLKRLNKIEKEIEIHARKTIKVPINAHTILLNTANFDELPIVHKSGQSSPHHHGGDPASSSSTKDLGIVTTSQSPLLQEQQHHLHNHQYHSSNHYPNHNHQLPNKILDEKLLVASVSLAANRIDRTKNGGATHSNDGTSHANRLNKNFNDDDDEFSFTDPLIGPSLVTDTSELYIATGSTASDDSDAHSGPHAIRGAPRSEFTCSGSDCDISWICLLIFILALCFAIPLIYIIYIAEHPEQFNHKENEQFGIVG